MRRGLGLALLTALLAACSSTEKPPPTPLEAVTPQIAGRQVWAARLDSVPFPLAPVVRDNQFIVAGGDGTVLALQADNGRELWRAQVGERIAAGVGSDGKSSAVVTRDNELVVLENAAVKWKQRLGSRVATAPLVAGGRVFVMGVDRVVQAFDAQDGLKLWTLQRPGDALTLAQSGVLASFRNTLLVGQGPRLVGVNPDRGNVVWDAAVATPRGTNEVERLADLIGPALRVGEFVCARAFQSAVGCVDAQRGSVVWSKNVSGGEPVGGDAEWVFGADATDRVTAWRAGTGEVSWTTERFQYRGLSGPLSAGKTVVFGDSEGYVHFLDRTTGATLLRLPTDGSPVVGRPVLSETTLLVVTRNGGLFAFRPE